MDRLFILVNLRVKTCRQPIVFSFMATLCWTTYLVFLHGLFFPFLHPLLSCEWWCWDFLLLLYVLCMRNYHLSFSLLAFRLLLFFTSSKPILYATMNMPKNNYTKYPISNEVGYATSTVPPLQHCLDKDSLC